MNILDVAPLLGVIFGTLLLVFVLLKKSKLGKDNKIRYILAIIVLYYLLFCLDYYFVLINDEGNWPFGIPYLFHHFIGFLFYYLIVLLTKTNLKLKKYIYIIVGYTLLRWAFFYPFFKFDNIRDFLMFVENSNYEVWLFGEYFFSNLVNILLFFFAFKRLMQAPMVIDLNQEQRIKFKWAKLMLIIFIVLQVSLFISSFVNQYSAENYEISLKFETLLVAIFFFLFTISLMQFPIFAFSGDYEDLPKESKKKYLKSSLKESAYLFNEIHDLIKEEELYLNFDLKLNTLAEKSGNSIHHVSQAINQNANMNFPDFINSFRIEEAKKKLLEPNPDTIYAISLDVGFNSKTAFYAAFKKSTSLTPTEFKKSR